MEYDLAELQILAAELEKLTKWVNRARDALTLIATPQRPDGTWNRDRAACRELAARALWWTED